MISIVPTAVGDSTIEHFSLGLWLVLLAYSVAVVGSIVGLACTRQSALAEDFGARQRWLALAAVCIGGVAVWLMHFIAMIGMRIPGSVARYDLGWTGLSALLSIGATYLALLMIGRSVRWLRLLAAGALMGIAVALMHYSGMKAVSIQGAVTYDSMLVAASVVIAIVASCVALWFTLTLTTVAARAAGGFVMGVAVVGMHYTGMAAMSVALDPNAALPSGLEVFTFLFPVLVAGMLALAVSITAVMMAPMRDRESDGFVAPDLTGDAAHEERERILA